MRSLRALHYNEQAFYTLMAMITFLKELKYNFISYLAAFLCK
jgi:hypothetical protein